MDVGGGGGGGGGRGVGGGGGGGRGGAAEAGPGSDGSAGSAVAETEDARVATGILHCIDNMVRPHDTTLLDLTPVCEVQ